LRQDMTVSVDIETARRAGALIVPTGAVRDMSSATPWVMVVRDKRTVRQAVTLGLRGDSRSEVLSGIEAGEVVVLATAVGIGVGRHVRPHLVSVAP